MGFAKKTIFVFDGDGNILMNLGSLVTIGSLKPSPKSLNTLLNSARLKELSLSLSYCTKKGRKVCFIINILHDLYPVNLIPMIHH